MAADGPDGSEGLEKLSSNVMNYLVWRYLQESGYGKTAKQLQYQWMGRDQSPEQLPFAPSIKKSCLVHLAQDGLFLDQMQAEVKNIKRQYVFGADHGRKFSVQAEEPRERKSRMRSTSRLPSTADRDMQNGSSADPPARGRGKGKRKSGGGAEKRVNGDAMDIDAATNTTSTNDVPMDEVASPLPIIEEMPPISTLEIGESKGTITEQPRDLTSSTSFVGLEDGLLLEQVTWSPHNRNALVTAGTNHMKVFKIAANVPESNVYTQSTSVDLNADHYKVQAFCWTEKGSGAFTTLEKFQNETGDELMVYKMFGFTEYGQKIKPVDSTAGWVLSLKYNPETQYLLALSWGEQSHIQIWDYSETVYENSKRRVDPKYDHKSSKTTESMLLDVAWVGPERFMVCGQHTLDLYEVVGNDVNVVKSIVTEKDWAKIEYDEIYNLVVVLDESKQAVGVVNVEAEDLQLRIKSLDAEITDVKFQPLHDKPSEEELESRPPQRILAASSTTGYVGLWDVLADPISCVQKLDMGWDSVASILAFSPDGFLLAAAGFDTLNVWKTLEGTTPKCVWRMPAGSNERWKVEEEKEENTNGVEGDGEDRFRHELGWDADGKRIAFGLGGQVAVIRL